MRYASVTQKRTPVSSPPHDVQQVGRFGSQQGSKLARHHPLQIPATPHFVGSCTQATTTTRKDSGSRTKNEADGPFFPMARTRKKKTATAAMQPPGLNGLLVQFFGFE